DQTGAPRATLAMDREGAALAKQGLHALARLLPGGIEVGPWYLLVCHRQVKPLQVALGAQRWQVGGLVLLQLATRHQGDHCLGAGGPQGIQVLSHAGVLATRAGGEDQSARAARKIGRASCREGRSIWM